MLTWLLVMPAAWAATRHVRMEEREYKPQTIFVNPGDTVRWTHRDGQTPHTVTSDTGAFDSSRNTSETSGCSLINDDCMRGGDTFEHEFEAAGSFPYHCKVHQAMTGTVRVVPRGGGGVPTSPSPSSPSVTPTTTSPSPTASSPSPTVSPTVSPTTSPTGTLGETPRAGGPDDGSNNGRIAVAGVGVVLLSAAAFLVYRRFISPS